MRKEFIYEIFGYFFTGCRNQPDVVQKKNIIVEVPKDLTAPQREALKNFKDTMGYSDVTPDEKRGFFGKKKK